MGDGKSAWENFRLHNSNVAPSKQLPHENMCSEKGNHHQYEVEAMVRHLLKQSRLSVTCIRRTNLISCGVLLSIISFFVWRLPQLDNTPPPPPAVGFLQQTSNASGIWTEMEKGKMFGFARLSVVIRWAENVGVVKFIVMRFLPYGNSLRLSLPLCLPFAAIYPKHHKKYPKAAQKVEWKTDRR